MEHSAKTYEILASEARKLRSIFIRFQQQPEKKGDQWCLRVGLDAYIWWQENLTTDELLEHISPKKGDHVTIGKSEYVVDIVHALQTQDLDVAEAFESGLIKELPLGWANGLKGEQLYDVVEEIYQTYNGSTSQPLEAMDWFMLVGLKPV
jgi:hypothetical protein